MAPPRPTPPSGPADDRLGIQQLAVGVITDDGTTGDPIASHESFWFAWSQFHPTTELWSR